MSKLLMLFFVASLGLSVAACDSGGFAQPAPSYGPRGGGNPMQGGGG